MAHVPLVSVLLAVADGERHLSRAVESVLRQSIGDLELLVVDDASTDRTPAILARFRDRRLVVLRSEERRGLAASLNVALDHARGQFVARLDADDVAFPDRLARQIERMRSSVALVALGSSALEVDDAGRPGRLLVMPTGSRAVRWAALFSSPFLHPTMLLDRKALERNDLRYDPDCLESEDYDLWTRLLETGDGDNLPKPLVCYRVHAGQASRRRGALQRTFQQRIALREIVQAAPELDDDRAQLAWRVGSGDAFEAHEVAEAARAFLVLLRAFESNHARDRPVREHASRRLAHLARHAAGAERVRLLREAAGLDRALPAHAAARLARRRALTRTAHAEARAWLAELDAVVGGADPASTPALRVAAVFPEPTPYRAPLLDRVAALDDLDLRVIYAAETVAGRTWKVEPRHPAVFLRGARLPGAERILHHEYPLTPGVVPALERARPDVVVVSGWSTFAAQAALAWCRARAVPYVLVVESHDEGPRAGWRKAVKGTVVPRVVQGAAAVLVTGTLARRSMVARGAPPERVHVFANTIDVQAFGERVDRLAGSRTALREGLGAGPDDVVVLSVARLAPEKGLDTLVHAVAETGDPRLLLVVAGDGPERERLEELARVREVRLVLAGDLEWERIVEAYAAADVFALLSEREPWAVVVNEAAACGLPLVLSDRVGAAHDLLRDGENGVLVPAGDVDAASEALRRLAADSDLRRVWGARSREIARDWGYGPSVEGFAAAVREAAASRPL